MFFAAVPPLYSQNYTLENSHDSKELNGYIKNPELRVIEKQNKLNNNGNEQEKYSVNLHKDPELVTCKEHKMPQVVQVALGSISIEDGFGVYFKSPGKLEMVEGKARAMSRGVFL